jgi:hypothetical protein
MELPKRGRGRPKGSKNRRPELGPRVDGDRGGASAAPAPSSTSGPSPATPPTPGTQRAVLEADRDRLLASIKAAGEAACASCLRGGDAKVEAALQSQLNGVNRMLLRISGETAPSDANLIRSPQWSRLKAKLFDALSKKHPEAWAAVLAIEAEG